MRQKPKVGPSRPQFSRVGVVDAETWSGFVHGSRELDKTCYSGFMLYQDYSCRKYPPASRGAVRSFGGLFSFSPDWGRAIELNESSLQTFKGTMGLFGGSFDYGRVLHFSSAIWSHFWSHSTMRTPELVLVAVDRLESL